MTQADSAGHASENASELRQRAEDAWHLRATELEQQVTSEQTQRLVHELQVHQIELEMQNEELRRVQEKLEAARDLYFDLYDQAPVGYLTLDHQGLIQRANLMLSTLLGIERAGLINLPLTRFIASEDQDTIYLQCRRVDETGMQQSCELRMVRQGGAPFWANVEIVLHPETGSGPPSYWLTVTDISARKQAQEAERISLT